jgi:hypothetical protein
LEAVLEEALRLYFESQLMQARIESAASEHAMRMVAMGNANRNAGDLDRYIDLRIKCHPPSRNYPGNSRNNRRRCRNSDLSKRE